MSLGNRGRGGLFRAHRERINTTIRKANTTIRATQSKEVVDRQQIHEFNMQATTPFNVRPCTRTAPTLYQFLSHKIAMTAMTPPMTAMTLPMTAMSPLMTAMSPPMTAMTQVGWVEQVGRETSIPDSLKKTRSTHTRCQPSIPPTISIRTRTKKKVAMILILAMALALKPPLRSLAREKAPGAEGPTRPVPQLHPFPFQLCHR